MVQTYAKKLDRVVERFQRHFAYQVVGYFHSAALLDIVIPGKQNGLSRMRLQIASWLRVLLRTL